MAQGQTLWELIESRAAESPSDLIAVDDRGMRVTFSEYRNLVERVAAGLMDLGVGAGTNVSWELPTWLESLVLIGAFSRLGAVQNPMIPIYRAREVSFVTRQTGARLLVVPSVWRNFDYAEMAREVAAGQPGLDVLVVDPGERKLPEGDPATLSPPPLPTDAEEVRWLFYTSGTTADPKGAKHTDSTLKAAAHGMNVAMDIRADDIGALAFPIAHIAGPVWLFSGTMVGCQQILVEQFDPTTTIPLLRQENVTLAGSGTAFHLAYLAAHRQLPAGEKLFPEVRMFPGGGAPKPPQLHYDLKSELGGAGIVSGYGLTECPILSMASVNDPDDKLANTEGQATPGVKIKVVTLEGKLAGPGEEGEIRVIGPQLFRSYVDSSLNADAFDEDGYFHTGDLGNLDAEGFVTITGRLKDVIIRKGENISAKEIEDLLYQHPKVADVAVIGIPDPASGERACAVVAPRSADDPLSFDEMVAFLKEQALMVQKIPEQLEVVPAVPRNPSGKALKHKLREQFGSGGDSR
jgi:acyl-CoA synthetase (AMP-forming)/AMP-acid ligase II